MQIEVTFKNFRCLRDSSLRLAPLTILVGANASGKSSILQALKPSLPLSEKDVWQHRSDLQAMVVRKLEGKKDSVSFYDSEHGGRGGWDSYAYHRLHLDLSHLRVANTLREEKRLEETGSNLTNLFASLSREKQGELVAQFCKLVPVFADIAATPLASGTHRLRFQDSWNRETWYEPDQVSDGSMLVLAFVLLQYQRQHVDLLAIEEPDRGLHPYLLGEIIALLRRLAEGQIGPKPIQVVLATHSPELLGFARPEEVRFLSRSPEDGSVEIKEAPTQSPGWEEAFNEYRQSLSSAWLSGGLGGVPGG